MLEVEVSADLYTQWVSSFNLVKFMTPNITLPTSCPQQYLPNSLLHHALNAAVGSLVQYNIQVGRWPRMHGVGTDTKPTQRSKRSCPQRHMHNALLPDAISSAGGGLVKYDFPVGR